MGRKRIRKVKWESEQEREHHEAGNGTKRETAGSRAGEKL